MNLSLGLANLSTEATNITPYEEEPVDIIEEPTLEDFKIAIDPSTGDLTSVEDLNTEPLVDEDDGVAPQEVTPSIENMNSMIPPTTTTRPTAKENIAIHKLHTAVGLEFLGELPKPPPAIFVDAANRVVRAFLNGVCYTTVSPLLHLMANASEEDTFIIEINSPMLRLEDIVSVISGIEFTKAKTHTVITAACRIPSLILGLSGTSFEILPSVHIFTPLTSFSVGSADEIGLSGEQFEKYSKLMIGYLVDRKVLTSEEALALEEESTIFTLTTDEIMSRMGESVEPALVPQVNAPLIPEKDDEGEAPSE